MALYKYNLKHDTPDSRDKVMLTHKVSPEIVPLIKDMRPTFPGIYDQGDVGSCTGNSIAGALDFIHKQDHPDSDFFYPSRLFIYYNERDMEGDVQIDGGASIRDGIKSVNSIGACKETTWPYIEASFAVKPSDAAYTEAKNYQAIQYEQVPRTLEFMKSTLAANIPIVTGISIYESFESQEVAATGIVPMPNLELEQSLGGHAVCVVGYDSNRKVFIVRNSWGVNWGDKGYFYLPFDYILNPNLCWDSWAIMKAE